MNASPCACPKDFDILFQSHIHYNISNCHLCKPCYIFHILCFLWWLLSFLAVSRISPQSLQINFSPPWTTCSSSPPLTILIFFIMELSSLDLCPLLGGILILKYYLDIKIYLWKKSNHLQDERYNTEISFSFEYWCFIILV